MTLFHSQLGQAELDAIERLILNKMLPALANKQLEPIKDYVRLQIQLELEPILREKLTTLVGEAVERAMTEKHERLYRVLADLLAMKLEREA